MCTRAYHFTCLNPPLDPDNGAPPGDWLCDFCSRPNLGNDDNKAFRDLREVANGRVPSSFRLPAALRDTYEGVKTGEDGEYEETILLKVDK